MEKTIRDRLASIRSGALENHTVTDCTAYGAIYVGTATCGRSAGSMEVFHAFEEALKNLDIKAKMFHVGCHGHCYAEPMAVVSKPGWPPILYGYLTSNRAQNLIKRFFNEEDPALEWALGAMEDNDIIPTVFETPRWGMEKRVLLENCGRIDPENINHYIALGGYEGLAYALEKEASKVVDDIKSSGLRGLGGAGFYTWRKWEMCRENTQSPKYVICNADEGDPGAFMDRTILESDPHAVIEGMIIAGVTIGAESGYIYIRKEYPLAVSIIKRAVHQARELGLLGENILGSGIKFEIIINQGAGAFVCGEETAMIASIEGKRGMPAPRPPYPAKRGLWGKPTLINNVKTCAFIPKILIKGIENFASLGTDRCKGTALFALAGKIRNAGLVEVPFGTTLREVIFDLGGGVPSLIKASNIPGEKPIAIQKKFKAVQIGGPSGGCLPEAFLDTPICFDTIFDTGAIMGSGGMVILDEDNCAVETARYFLEFTQKESCGKCTFCRVGTKHLFDILTKITKGTGTLDDLEMLQELAETIKQGSLCNLGRTAPNPVLTTLLYLKDEYEAHILEKRCPSLECKDLIAYYIIPEKCQRACDACVGSCPTEAIYTRRDRLKAIDQEKCVKCENCLDACPPQYDAVIKVSPVSELPESKPDEEKQPKENGI
ncbi:MAG: NADH-ubiquinone oxidoreductase-F iron-sulfur binding region domain-containing protein [Thermodesulfobacteriota bacterium]|nr:NADH-ubiquinone oxidoreductase-F iron-sulfur binding region domain-containing protein [Thermodesulfobacteriota bacterium]